MIINKRIKFDELDNFNGEVVHVVDRRVKYLPLEQDLIVRKILGGLYPFDKNGGYVIYYYEIEESDEIEVYSRKEI